METLGPGVCVYFLLGFQILSRTRVNEQRTPVFKVFEGIKYTTYRLHDVMRVRALKCTSQLQLSTFVLEQLVKCRCCNAVWTCRKIDRPMFRRNLPSSHCVSTQKTNIDILTAVISSNLIQLLKRLSGGDSSREINTSTCKQATQRAVAFWCASYSENRGFKSRPADRPPCIYFVVF
jgi:hypothetical protein